MSASGGTNWGWNCWSKHRRSLQMWGENVSCKPLIDGGVQSQRILTKYRWCSDGSLPDVLPLSSISTTCGHLLKGLCISDISESLIWGTTEDEKVSKGVGTIDTGEMKHKLEVLSGCGVCMIHPASSKGISISWESTCVFFCSAPSWRGHPGEECHGLHLTQH